jgi:hypothetical protein
MPCLYFISRTYVQKLLSHRYNNTYKSYSAHLDGFYIGFLHVVLSFSFLILIQPSLKVPWSLWAILKHDYDYK